MPVNDNQGLDPNRMVEDLDKFSGWVLNLLENNGSDEIDEEGAPLYANYSSSTQAMLAMAFAQARLVRIISACTFRLHQGDFSEEQFHHAIEEAMDKLEEEASNCLG